MTMIVRITNKGPQPYVALVKDGDKLLATLNVGESTEQYTWHDGRKITIEEEGLSK